MGSEAHAEVLEAGLEGDGEVRLEEDVDAGAEFVDERPDVGEAGCVWAKPAADNAESVSCEWEDECGS